MRINTDRLVSIMANAEQTYVTARNTGVGPALIENVVIRYRGSESKKDPHDFFMLDTEGQGANTMVREFLSLFALGDAPQSWYDGAGLAKSGPEKAIIEVTYRSVYGDRWRVTSDKVVPEPL